MKLFLKVFLGTFFGVVLGLSLPYETQNIAPVASAPVVEVANATFEEKADLSEFWACIRTKESGNDNDATGKLGELGAYQILPSTWVAADCRGDWRDYNDNKACRDKVYELWGPDQWSTFDDCEALYKEKSP